MSRVDARPAQAGEEQATVATGSPTVNRVLRGELCSGCGLCAAVSGGALRMESSAPGYNRPVGAAPVSADAERVIAQACPGSVVAPWPSESRVHPYWGPLRKVLTGYATDETIRTLRSGP